MAEEHTSIPRSTAHYREHKDDPEFLRGRREYKRRYREAMSDDPELRALDGGCALCGEREKTCIDLFKLTDGQTICLCANDYRRWRSGRVGLPHWVPQELRWRLGGRARRRKPVALSAGH